MQYTIKLTAVIDSESDKDTFRNFVKTKMMSNVNAKKMVSWNMDIKLTAEPVDDEHYSSVVKEE